MANRLPRRQWMVGKDRGQDKEQNTSGGVAQLRRDRRRWWWIEPRFFWSKSPVFWPFPATWTAGKRRPSSKLQISTLLGRWHGRKWERQPSRIHGFRSTRFSFPSLPVSFFFFFSLSFSLWWGIRAKPKMTFKSCNCFSSSLSKRNKNNFIPIFFL